MKISFVSSCKVPSDTANSIQVMKVCQAFAQLGHEVTLVVPGDQLSAISFQQLQSHYGLTTSFAIQWLPARARRFFPWNAVRRARTLKADLLYCWPIRIALPFRTATKFLTG